MSEFVFLQDLGRRFPLSFYRPFYHEGGRELKVPHGVVIEPLPTSYSCVDGPGPLGAKPGDVLFSPCKGRGRV